MSVNIGAVATFADVQPSKEQALKPLEEAAEIFSSWQMFDYVVGMCGYNPDDVMDVMSRNDLINECCDLIQATCNLLVALGVEDIAEDMAYCKKRNEQRGRAYE